MKKKIQTTIKKVARRSRDEMKHEAILKAATRLFLKNGYTNTSMDAIADMARVTKQTVYSHYNNKDALFTKMVTSLCERQEPTVATLEASGQDAETLLYKIGIVFLDMMTSKDVLAATRLVIAEANQHPKLAELYYEAGTHKLIEMLSQFLELLNKRGDFSIKDTGSAASYYLAILKGRFYLRMILALKPVPDKEDKEFHVRESVQIFMRMYAGATPLETKSIF